MRRHARSAASVRLIGLTVLVLLLSGLGMAAVEADIALGSVLQRLAASHSAAAADGNAGDNSLSARGRRLIARAAAYDTGQPDAGRVDPSDGRPAATATPDHAYPFPLAWPASGGITTYFHEPGPYWVGGYHQGIDIAADYGTDVQAAAGGLVIVADDGWNKGYGTCVEIDHGGGIHTFYGHFSHLDVEPGQSVARGQVVGQVGASGFSVGAHLHFEVRRDGKLDDPLAYLPLRR